MIKAIIFDCFGVLSTDGWLPFRTKYFAQDKALYDEATMMNRQCDAGLLPYDALINWLAEKSGQTPDQVLYELEHHSSNTPLFDYIRTELKPHYRIGVMSNAARNWLDILFSEQETALFDGVILSYQLGHTKPEREAYEAIATKLGVLPEECVFIDDQERFATAANDVGMRGIHFISLEQLKPELEKVLVK